jgi:hypothetical protein
MTNVGTEHGPHAHGPIRLNLRTLQQLFYSLDPSPFRDRDLDPEAARFIVEEAMDRVGDEPITIILHMPAEDAARADFVPGAIRNYFALLRQSERRRMRMIFREGRWSLAVGLVAVFVIFALARFLTKAVPADSLWHTLVDSLVILGWVVLWRPAELLLYDWWPVRRRMQLYRRLEEARVECLDGG